MQYLNTLPELIHDIPFPTKLNNHIKQIKIILVIIFIDAFY